MRQRDQPVGLAAPVGRIEPENRSHLATRPGQPPAHIGEQVFKAPCGIGVREEAGRVEIFVISLADDDLGQVRREVGFGDVPLEDISPGTASLKYRGNVHVDRFTCFPQRSSKPYRASAGRVRNAINHLFPYGGMGAAENPPS